MNFGEMQSEVRIRIDEATEIFWNDTDIKDSLNEGLMALSDATEWYERMTNIPLWEKRTYFDVRELLSDEFIAPKRCLNLTTNKWLAPSSVRSLDKTYPQWEKTQGEPLEIFTRGIYWIGFYPKPTNDVGLARLYFSAIPPEMSDSTDEPELPEEYHIGIVDYAVYDLLAQDAETEKALIWYRRYKETESSLNDYVNGRITKDRIGKFGN